jgi:hypothetical protein
MFLIATVTRYPASYSVGLPWDLVSRIQLSECEDDHSPPSSAEIIMRGASPSLLHTSSWHGAKAHTVRSLNTHRCRVVTSSVAKW